MRRILLCWLLCGIAVSAVGAGERWLHVRIGEDGERTDVRINVPLSVAAGFLSTVDSSDWTERTGLDTHGSLDARELRAVLAALEDAPDSEMITVRDGDDHLRVAKERGFLVVHADERGGDRVRVRVPLKVIEAAFRGSTDEIDLAAALEALADHGDADLVTIEGDGERVRIWVDTRESGGD